jgi:Tol biopolymer transport system component
MKAQLVLAACIAFAAAGAAVPGASRSAEPPIVPNYDIYSISVIRGTPTRLTTDSADELSPSLSPDGTTIVFSRGADLWLMGADGSGQRLLAPAPDRVSYTKPSWSANGRLVAFTAWDVSACSPGSRRCAAPSVQVIHSDGSGLRKIASWAMSPRWSPRGQRLAFAGNVLPFELRPRSIYSVSLAGSGPRLAHAEAGVDSPSWSPDARKIAYTRSGRTGPAVYVLRADRSRSRRVARGERPEWSPRGDRIALSDRGRLYVASSRGRPRTKRIAFANQYSWNRRGSMLALVDFRLAVIQPSGQSFRILCCEERFGFGEDAPAWSRAGDRLFYALKLSGPPPA